MATRFNKKIKVAPGVKLNLNKKSASITVGTKGAHITKSTTGKTTRSVGIPGSGLSWRETTGGASEVLENTVADVPAESVNDWMISAKYLAMLTDSAFSRYRAAFFNQAHFELSENDFLGQSARINAETARRRHSRWSNRLPWLFVSLVSFGISVFFAFQHAFGIMLLFFLAFAVLLFVTVAQNGQASAEDAEDVIDVYSENEGVTDDA